MRRLAFLVLATLALRPAMAAAEDDLELAVKATYLVKFQPFVTWPPSAFPAADSPFTLCVVGSDPFGSILDRAVSGQSAGGHPMAVRRLEAGGGAADCQILYIAPGDSPAARRAAEAVRGRPVLTVTDEGGPDSMLNFVMTDGRVRFTIDENAARESGLDISSKLLRLAVSVRRGSMK